MGCFSMTCAVGGLPINDGDEIVAVPVVESRRSCGLGDWSPAGLPIYGAYDSYGRIIPNTGLDTEFANLFCKAVSSRVVEKEIGENEYHDVAVKKDMNFVEYMSAIWEERLEVADSHGTGLVSFSYIRRDVWDKVLDSVSSKARSWITDRFISLIDLKKSGLNYIPLTMGFYGALTPETTLRHLISNDYNDQILTEAQVRIEQVVLVNSSLRSVHRSWRKLQSFGPQCGGWVDQANFLRDLLDIAMAKAVEELEAFEE